MEKITFGKGGRWCIYTYGVPMTLAEVLAMRGYDSVDTSEVKESAMWRGTKRIVAVRGVLHSSESTRLLYFAPDTETDEKVREALSWKYPQYSAESIYMDKPE